MQHVRQYHADRTHVNIFTWADRIHECAASMRELAEQYCPDAVPLANILMHIRFNEYEKVLRNYAPHITKYRTAMRRRAVSTQNHYVINGYIFIARYIIYFNFTKNQAVLSPEPKRYYCISAGETSLHVTASYTKQFAAVSAKIDEDLIEAFEACGCCPIRDIREEIYKYVRAPTAYLQSL